MISNNLQSWMGIVKVLYCSLYSFTDLWLVTSVQQWRGSFVCDSLRPIQERLTAGSWDVWKSFIVCDSLIRCLMHSIGSVSSKIGKAVAPPPHFCPDHWFANLKQRAREVILKGQLDYTTLGLFGNVSFALVNLCFQGLLWDFNPIWIKHCFANFLDKITVGGSSTADIPFDLYNFVLFLI